MDRSSEQQWITSLLQHRLGCANVAYTDSAKGLLGKQLTLEMNQGIEQPSDMIGWNAEALAWEIALTAQSCAYLALELQVLAQRFSGTQITCPESTFKQLYDSLATFRDLVESMLRNYKECNENGNELSAPALSERMVAEIRYMLAQDHRTT